MIALRLRAAVVTLGFTLATLAPMVPDAEGRKSDGFPFSWYPMFSQARPARERVTWVRARLGDGTTRPVSVVYWTRGGLTEGRSQLEAAIRGGPAAMDRFCGRLAETLGRRRRGWEARVEGLELLRSTWTLEGYFASDTPTPLDERVLRTCEVRR